MAIYPGFLRGGVSALLSTIFDGMPENWVNSFKLFDYRLHSPADHVPEKASSSIGLSIKGRLVGRSPLFPRRNARSDVVPRAEQLQGLIVSPRNTLGPRVPVVARFYQVPLGNLPGPMSPHR